MRNRLAKDPAASAKKSRQSRGRSRAKIAKVLDAHIESGHFDPEDIWRRQHRHPVRVEMDPLDNAAIEDVTACPFTFSRPMKQVDIDAQAEAVEQYQLALQEAKKQGFKAIRWVAFIIGAAVVVVAIALATAL